MNISVIEEIKKAEEQAKEILDSSKEESKKIFNDALNKANNEYENIVNKANDEYKKILSDYEVEANNYAMTLEKKSETNISDIFNISEEKKKIGVKKVIERIVGVWQ